jgi:PH domain/C2 domain
MSAQVDPERIEFVGYLTKRGGKRKNWLRRRFELRDNVITYYSESRIRGVERRKGVVPLDAKTTVECAAGDENEHGRFGFELVTDDRVYRFEADSAAEREQWLQKLCEAIDDIGARRHSACNQYYGDALEVLDRQAGGGDAVPPMDRSASSVLVAAAGNGDVDLYDAMMRTELPLRDYVVDVCVHGARGLAAKGLRGKLAPAATEESGKMSPSMATEMPFVVFGGVKKRGIIKCSKGSGAKCTNVAARTTSPEWQHRERVDGAHLVDGMLIFEVHGRRRVTSNLYMGYVLVELAKSTSIVEQWMPLCAPKGGADVISFTNETTVTGDLRVSVSVKKKN